MLDTEPALTEDLTAMIGVSQFMQWLLCCWALCFRKAEQNSSSKMPSSHGYHKMERQLQAARVGGGRRWRHIRRAAKPAVQAEDEEELAASDAVPVWVLQENWRQLCMQRRVLCEEQQHIPPCLAFSEGKDIVSALPLLCLGLKAFTRELRKRSTNKVEVSYSQQETKSSSVSVGSPTNKVHSELRSIDKKDFENLVEKTILGDGNCFWRALSKAVGQPWQHLKSSVLKYAAKAGHEHWCRQHAPKGVWIDNAGVRLAAEALQATINIDAGGYGCWQIKAGEKCQAWLKLRQGHYSLMRPGEEQCAQGKATVGPLPDLAGGAPKPL